ncbi:hypothetical protein [uncultured Dietzia sp.]|uniref:hypothetical protein n=1 Tax=uncultured Dietzia sp. TaxID=395519 RepID=UPI0025D434B4|nr:hypothetical protein [uncultured Dietzia sp.]
MTTHGGEPVPLAAALDALRMTGMGSPRAESRHDEPPRADGADPTAGPAQVAAHWPDGPGRVLERTDALALSEVEWDRDVVFDAVREVAALAHLEYTRIRLIEDPAEFPVDPEAFAELRRDERSENPLRMGWVRHLGILADRRLVRRLREWTATHSRTADPAPGGSDGPGHIVSAYAEAGRWVENDGVFEGILLSPVTDLVEAYVGFMIDQGAAGWDDDWHPRDGVIEEFGTDLEIGRLLTDAFGAGLGYLALVDGEIAVARRPVLRLLEAPGVDGRPRFHHECGPAIEFAGGAGLHFLKGVLFPGWTHRAIVDGALTMRYVRDMECPDVRIAAYSSMPPAALLDGLDPALVDMGAEGTLLYRIDAMPDHDRPVWYTVTTDPSTNRERGEFVPPEVGALESADAARAAALGLSVEDYLRMTLEG